MVLRDNNKKKIVLLLIPIAAFLVRENLITTYIGFWKIQAPFLSLRFLKGIKWFFNKSSKSSACRHLFGDFCKENATNVSLKTIWFRTTMKILGTSSGLKSTLKRSKIMKFMTKVSQFSMLRINTSVLAPPTMDRWEAVSEMAKEKSCGDPE